MLDGAMIARDLRQYGKLFLRCRLLQYPPRVYLSIAPNVTKASYGVFEDMFGGNPGFTLQRKPKI